MGFRIYLPQPATTLTRLRLAYCRINDFKHDLDLMPRMPMWFARPKTVIHHIIIIVYYAEAAQHTKKI